MTLSFAFDYMTLRMAELGYKNYAVRIRHFMLRPNEVMEIPAWQELFMLVDEPTDLRVQSDFGLFDMVSQNASELQYEHQGLITLTNLTGDCYLRVRMLQAIPLENTETSSLNA